MEKKLEYGAFLDYWITAHIFIKYKYAIILQSILFSQITPSNYKK
jgi:hypothetical protein